ncbi:Hint domain-containing protein [Asaia siamensis]
MSTVSNHLPNQISSVYAYRLNVDGTLTALYGNEAIGPLTAKYTSSYLQYVDSQGNIILNTQSPTAGIYQTSNGFISYNYQAPDWGITLFTNDQIQNPSQVHWVNQNGVPIGSKAPADYFGNSTSLTLSDSSGYYPITYPQVLGGANSSAGSYDEAAHANMPGVAYPYGYLPTTLHNVYLYVLKADGSIMAGYDNEAIPTMTASYDGTTWIYTDGDGNRVSSSLAGMTGIYQTENGFVIHTDYNLTYLISNDKIAKPAEVSWSNQSGAVPGAAGFPSFMGSTTSITLTDNKDNQSASLSIVPGGVTSQGTYDPNAHNVMPGNPLPDVFLPKNINSIYVYLLNSDGTVTATNNNAAIGPLQVSFDGKTWTYTDASGNIVATSPNASTGMYQSRSSFVTYDSSRGALLFSNDPINDPEHVRWSNQAGSVPGANGFPNFAGSTSSIVLSDTIVDNSLYLSQVSGGVVTQGNYDPNEHVLMPGLPLPDTFLPTTLDNVYVYLLNSDGTVTATNNNNAIGPLKASFDGKTWTYTDASGNVVATSPNASAGMYQTQNGFVTYDSSRGALLFSNDQITNPEHVKWANQAGSVPGSTGFPNFAGWTTLIKLSDTVVDQSLSLSQVSGGVVTQGSYDPNAHAVMPGVPFPEGYLPTNLDNIYVYLLNSDGTVTATHGNAPIGPLTASFDGKIWTYTDASGNVISSSQNGATGMYQTSNGFVSYDVSQGILLFSNDKISDPSKVTWANQNGSILGSSTIPDFIGSSTSIKLSDTAGDSSLAYGQVLGGVVSPGVYDPNAHAAMPGVALPLGYLPSELNDVYLYIMNSDGTLAAKNANEAVGPLKAQYDGTTWTYVDAEGNIVLTGPNTTTGVYQTENGFVSYSVGGGWILVSNDKIPDASELRWSNQSGETPGNTPFPIWAPGSTSLIIQNATGDKNVSYDFSTGGATAPGVYDPNAHQDMPCFLEGTRILTAAGYKNVEALALTDEVAVFRNGEAVWRPIKALAVGVCQVKATEHDDRAGYPVVIRQGALGHGVPFKDLRVTADHGIEVEGRLFLARSLVDGEKIYFDKSISTYRYFHTDLHDHEVIEADGARVESYGDDGYRALFNNASMLINTTLSFDTAIPLKTVCVEPDVILAMREKLGLKEMQDDGATPDALNFHFVTEDGQELRPRSMAGSRYSFLLPEHVSTVRMVSAAARPYDVIGVHRDDRRALGVLIGEITVFEASAAIRQDGHLLNRPCVGWTALENDQCRWTKGDARLDLEREDTANAAIISIDVLDDCVRFGRA